MAIPAERRSSIGGFLLQPRQRRGSISKLKDSGGSSPPSENPMAFDPIEAALRQLYDSMVADTIPEDFLRILDQLAEEEQGDDS